MIKALLYLSFLILIVCSPDSQARDSWNNVMGLVDRHCNKHGCSDRTAKEQFQLMLRHHQYGCLVFLDEKHVEDGLQRFDSLTYRNAYLQLYQPDEQKSTQQQRLASRLKASGLLSRIQEAIPEKETAFFYPPFAQYCGNNALVLNNGQWHNAGTIVLKDVLPKNVVLIIFE